MTLARRDAERALLIGVHWKGRAASRNSGGDLAEHLEELTRLAESAGANVVRSVSQERSRPDPALLIGKGMVDGLKGAVRDEQIDVVIFDEELTPAQNRNLETTLDTKVIDRTGLILDIFASRARSREGKLQVELAQMEYLYPRLVGRWMHFSRQVGGIGMRGPGETQLEVDRRLVRQRIAVLSRELKTVAKSREIRRERRLKDDLPLVALVGYTNAGKSSLLNALAGSSEYTDDLLFATLDPVTRRVRLEKNLTGLMTDTVGFVQKLPHELVAAFRSTFEEIKNSDLLLHVIDAANPQADLQALEVERVLGEFGMGAIPVIKVYNKLDSLPESARPAGNGSNGLSGMFWVSAKDGTGMDALRTGMVEALGRRWPIVKLKVPLSDGKTRAKIYAQGEVVRETVRGNFLWLEARVPKALAAGLSSKRAPRKKRA